MFSFNIYVYYWEIHIFNFFFMCFNIQGLLQFENVSYGIEPLESSTTYEHVIYPFRDKKVIFLPYQRTVLPLNLQINPTKFLLNQM